MGRSPESKEAYGYNSNNKTRMGTGRHGRASALWQHAQPHVAKGTDHRVPCQWACSLTAQALEMCGVIDIETGQNSLVSSASGEQVVGLRAVVLSLMAPHEVVCTADELETPVTGRFPVGGT